MEVTWLPAPARALALGVVAGVLSGLFGVGGGVVLVPGLLALFALSQHRAHATSLAAILLTATAALVPYALDHEVGLAPALWIAVGALSGAYVGAGFMRRVPEARLRQAFAVLVVVVAVRLLVGFDVSGGGATLPVDAARAALLVLLGLSSGVLSSLLGVGGGVILVPLLVLVFGFSQHAAEGTSLAVIVPTALVGALRHTRSGYTAWRLGALVGLGGIGGGVLGALLALALPSGGLQRLFGAFLLLTGLRLLAAAFARARR